MKCLFPSHKYVHSGMHKILAVEDTNSESTSILFPTVCPIGIHYFNDKWCLAASKSNDLELYCIVRDMYLYLKTAPIRSQYQ